MELSGTSIFKMEPKDSIIGAFYNFHSEKNTDIYNGVQYLDYSPEYYGEKIVKLLLKAKKSEEFYEQKFQMNGQTELFYILVAFDKSSNFPVYFLKYYTTQQMEVFYTDYNFETNINNDLFTRKYFPADYEFLENPKAIWDKKLEIGIVAPDWTLKSIYDKEIKLKDLRGTPVLLIFSEIWCVPCMLANPDLNEITKSNKNIKVISIYPRDKRESLKKLVKSKKIIYDILDNSADVGKAYLINWYPTFMIIDKDGILKYNSAGYGEETKKKLEVEIEKIIKNN